MASAQRRRGVPQTLRPETVLVVSTFPPRKCGVGAYAYQAVGALRRAGARVDVLSPPDCAGTFRAPLRGFLNPLRVLKYAHRYDRIVVQYSHPEFYFGDPPRKFFNVLTTLSFFLLFIVCRHLEVVIHEPPQFPSLVQGHVLAPLTWRLVPHVAFHTDLERRTFESHLHLRFRAGQYSVLDHKRDFTPFVTMTREEARKRLHIPRDRKVFLCIGFVQPSKGFDRAVSIFVRRPPGALLYVVGSVRRAEDAAAFRHRDQLARAARSSDNVRIVDQYPSDTEFDMWIIAADYVVLPYRTISSSGVLARASILNRPALVAATGGLAEQVGPQDLVFRTDQELEAAINGLVEQASAP